MCIFSAVFKRTVADISVYLILCVGDQALMTILWSAYISQCFTSMFTHMTCYSDCAFYALVVLTLVV